MVSTRQLFLERENVPIFAGIQELYTPFLPNICFFLVVTHVCTFSGLPVPPSDYEGQITRFPVGPLGGVFGT